MQIDAAIVHEPNGAFSIEQVQLEAPRPDEVLVEMVAVGICHTDLVVRDQHIPTPLPAVLGHEGVGIVREVGTAVEKLAVGDHVVMTFAHCGQCGQCRRGALPYCDHGFDYQFKGSRPDGTHTISQNGQAIGSAFFHQSSFATHAVATEKNTVKVRKDAPLEWLAPLACGVQTGAGAIINSFQPRAGSSVAVFGTGAVGLSAVMAAVIAGCRRIIAIDINPDRLQLAGELGATDMINPNDCEPVGEIRKILDGGADFSLENTGLPQVMRQAVDCLHTRGVCGQIGAPPLGTEAALDMIGIMSGRTVRGIIEGDAVPDTFIPQLVDWYLDGRLPIDRMVRFFDFKDINEAVQAAESGEVIKPVLLFRNTAT